MRAAPGEEAAEEGVVLARVEGGKVVRLAPLRLLPTPLRLQTRVAALQPRGRAVGAVAQAAVPRLAPVGVSQWWFQRTGLHV
jgi:hypothetical protein